MLPSGPAVMAFGWPIEPGKIVTRPPVVIRPIEPGREKENESLGDQRLPSGLGPIPAGPGDARLLEHSDVPGQTVTRSMASGRRR